MIKSILLIVICFSLFSPNYTYSQKDGLSTNQIMFTTSLLDYLVGPVSCRNLNLGAEFYTRNNNSISLNFGKLESFGSPSSTGYFSYGVSSTNTSGYKIQLERKHYLNIDSIFWPSIALFWPHILQFKSQDLEYSGYYYAGNIFYQNTKTDRTETLVNPVDQNTTNQYEVARNVYSANLKFGYQCIKKYGLVIDYSVGLGAQYIASSTNNKIGDNTINNDRDFPWRKQFDNGSGIYPHLCYQLKLGWAF